MKDDLVALYDSILPQLENGTMSPNKMKDIYKDFLNKHPELKPAFQDYFDKISSDTTTGKESMSVSQLVQENKQLEQNIIKNISDTREVASQK